MKTCDKCNVSINTTENICPLCQSELIGDDGNEIFPCIPTTYKQYSVLFRILIFASVVVGVVAVLINLLLPESGFWSLLVLLALACVWLSIAVIIRKKENVRKAVMYQVVIISLIAVVWDLIFGWIGWSIDYIVPICCVVAMILFAILYKVLHASIREYLFYFFIDAFFGIIPIVFYLTGALGVVIPSLICVATSLVSLAAMIVFMGKELQAELRRRFHF